MSNCEALIAAVEEAQRILSLYDDSGPRRNQDELLAMLQFIICAPSVTTAMRHLGSTGRSDRAAGNDNMQAGPQGNARIFGVPV